jgi:hypothetical protein
MQTLGLKYTYTHTLHKCKWGTVLEGQVGREREKGGRQSEYDPSILYVCVKI